MRKKIAILAGLLFMGSVTFAQKGNNQVGIGAELAIPTNGWLSNGSNIGFGATVKGMYGISSNGQIELTTGYLYFPGKTMIGIYSANMSVIPIMVGYRHHFSNLYVEPQLGGALLLSKIETGGLIASSKDFGFSWAVGAGYMIHDFDISARYQMLVKNGSGGFFGVRLGYNFHL